MKLKISWIELSQDLLPHSDLDSAEDLKLVSNEILEAFEIGGYSEELELDDKILAVTSVFSSKLLQDISKLIKIYEMGRWGKLLSGDVVTVVGETITYALLNQLFGISINDILPFRNVKFLGTISDLAINIEKYDKLRKFLNAKNGLLFVEAKATMTFRRSQIVNTISKSLVTIENLRYPDNYGLISYVVKYNNQLYDMMILIKP
ncbi:conserved hypothetical protein [Sulfolobus islandicus Y.G.57.14]|uniref:Uncharacterized protein n=4 Tax=Saccharolobus islandicus TaxID=43080 RepID=C3MQ19_SACI2|nr:hypothetical protein [Sulfolobus islandicus]ACP35482.1 conserved hypothetical protein [Sulfolobus islandicus L.S.2.15]ACP45640.1 conserved hypothetical protein [Sulfolobus islandicus Y.G.57.14]ACP48558.1 conserved hypothetical protein [Sulfolobus islandicus Y.N.15.51]ADB87169.1 conserved hypothetical protein [Sulfolobus islandicus L.D.8.5]PVU78686.1 hypothetical protein DDW12_01920 [Sulfolobus islandicus]